MSSPTTANRLIFSPGAVIRFGGNVFIDIPVILQVDGAPLIETIKNNEISRTTGFMIYHADGTFLAKVVGTCLFCSPEGEKAGLELSFPSRTTVCTLGRTVLFEVRRVAAASMAISAELFSPAGLLVKAGSLAPLTTFAKAGGKIAETVVRNIRVRNMKVGYSIADKGKTIALGLK